MGDSVVELSSKQFEQIGEFVKSHLEEWVGEIRREREFDLLERMVRVEEELKSLRELMNERYVAMDKRFSSLQWTMGIGFTLIAALMGVLNFL